MSVGLALVVVLAVLLVLLIIQVPVAFALGASGILGIVLVSGGDIAGTVMARLPFQATARYSLIVVPMFIFMGLLAMQGGIADDAFKVANRVLGRFPGGLGLATIAACAGFAAVSGSSVATVATVGRTAIGEMRRYGFDTALAAGIVGAAGTLGVLIPPSIVLVLYGIVSGESIGALLLAGIIPGLLSAVLYAVLVVVLARRAEKRRPHPTSTGSPPPSEEEPAGGTRSESVATLTADSRPPSRGYVGIVRITILFTIVVGGIYTGVFTATESAALGGFVALILATLYLIPRERLGTFRKLGQAAQDAASVTSMVFAILVGATIFTAFLVQAGVPTALTQWIIGLDVPPMLIVLIFLAAMIPLGMFLDPVSILLITVPLAYPIVTSLGFDGIWFGILTVKMIELGLITPPVGLNAYVVAGSTEGVTVEDAFRGLTPFFGVDLLTVGLLIAMPQLVTWLPHVARGT